MTPLKHILFIVLCCYAILSCQQLPEDDGWNSTEAEKHLKVKVRSAGEAIIDYPLYLYAFDENGELSASQKIEDNDIDMALPLDKGEYQIVAISGTSEAYQWAEKPTLEDVITITGNQGASTALMMGKANVKINNASEATAEITLSYCVAELNVTLKDIPTNISNVELTLSPLHSTLSMDGKYEGDPQKIKIECTSDTKGTWIGRTTYIYPGSGTESILSILLKTEDGEEITYGHTYQGIPKANQHFNINGSYSKGIIIGGKFDVTDWEGAIEVDFTFGADVVPEEETESDDTEIDLSSVPEVGSIWNGTIVADIGEADENGVNLLLMSLDEWEATTSDISDIMDGYSVNELTGWRLPTHDEAALLRARFSGTGRLELNELIEEYDPDLYGLANGEKERYLCLKNDAYYSFRFVSGTTTTKAGEKRTYYVRLVKTYSMALEQ